MNAVKGTHVYPDGQTEHVAHPFAFPGELKKVTQLRLDHFVMRGVTRCRLVDFTALLGPMTMAEVQLVYEVVLPYLMHDWVQLGVPEAVVLGGCGTGGYCCNCAGPGSRVLHASAAVIIKRVSLLHHVPWLHMKVPHPPPDSRLHCRVLIRYATMLLTRHTTVDCNNEYMLLMDDAKAAMQAAQTLLEAILQGCMREKGQTVKSHKFLHAVQQAAGDRCHPTRSNDMVWERHLRNEATLVCKCDPSYRQPTAKGKVVCNMLAGALSTALLSG
jgi:hypothetical protein